MSAIHLTFANSEKSQHEKFTHSLSCLLREDGLTSWANARLKLHSQVHFGSETIVCPKKLFVQKSFGSKNFGVQNNFWSNKIFSKLPITSWANTRLKLHSQVHFESKKMLVPKKCWVQKSFNSKIFLGPVIT